MTSSWACENPRTVILLIYFFLNLCEFEFAPCSPSLGAAPGGPAIFRTPSLILAITRSLCCCSSRSYIFRTFVSAPPSYFHCLKYSKLPPRCSKLVQLVLACFKEAFTCPLRPIPKVAEEAPTALFLYKVSFLHLASLCFLYFD